MHAERLIRISLGAGSAFNLGVAWVLATPGSALGQRFGLPPEPGPIYPGLCAVLVALFGLAYAWLAAQRRMDQALLGLAASGKAAVFVLFAVLWTRGAVSEVVLLAAVGDLGFAALWAWWLLRGARRSRGDAA